MSRTSDQRGVSEVVGYVLILGMVLVSVTAVTLVGSIAVDETKQRNDDQATELAMSEADATFASLSADTDRSEIDLGGENPDRFSVVNRSGRITLSVDDRCTTTIGLSSLEHRNPKGQRIAYEAGGVWRSTDDGDSVMVSPPDLTYENRTIGLRVLDMAGRIGGSTDSVRWSPKEPPNSTADHMNRLFDSKECERPDEIDITVESAYYEAWGKYMEREFNVDATVKNAARTASIELGHDELPPELDDDTNHVVEFGENGFVDSTTGAIRVDKGVSNEYAVYARPLGGGPQVSEIRRVDTPEVYRPPLDVAFVVDESGSMAGEKEANAKTAEKSFIAKLNGSRDRVGIIGYSQESRYITTRNGEYLTSDFSDDSGANRSVDRQRANGGTYIETGLEKSNALFDLKSNGSRNKVAVLLSDGENSDPASNSASIEAAKRARKAGVTVHTIGIGSKEKINETLLRRIASETNGTYKHVEDSSDLNGVFEELLQEIVTADQIVHTPVSTSMSVDGTTHYPTIGGNTTGLASANDANGRPIYNLNDPTAPDQFSFRTTAKDGDVTKLTALRYDCEEWETTTLTRRNNGTKYNEVRCAKVAETGPTELDASKTTLYTDGEDVSSLLAEESAWWQDDLRNDTFDGLLVDSDGDGLGETLSLESNEVVVVHEYPNEGGGYNRIAMLYRIGLADSEVDGRYVLDLEVGNVEIGD